MSAPTVHLAPPRRSGASEYAARFGRVRLEPPAEPLRAHLAPVRPAATRATHPEIRPRAAAAVNPIRAAGGSSWSGPCPLLVRQPSPPPAWSLAPALRAAGLVSRKQAARLAGEVQLSR
jgi:hypothetical protein